MSRTTEIFQATAVWDVVYGSILQTTSLRPNIQVTKAWAQLRGGFCVYIESWT